MEPLIIPPDRLSAEALLGVIDDYVTREGTDYGHSDVGLDDKRAAVRRQLERGEAVIVFDPETETTTIVAKRELTRGRGG